MTTEVLALIGTIITLVSGGVGFFVKWSLGQADKRVEAAEKRETEANARAKDERDVQNKRIDAATEAINSQSRVIGELTAALKLLGDGHREEMRKANDGITTLLARSGRNGST